MLLEQILRFGMASAQAQFARPALVPTAAGEWRQYVAICFGISFTAGGMLVSETAQSYSS